MKKSIEPAPLTPDQIRLVLEMIDLRQLAPKDVAARFNRLIDAGTFSSSQRDAIEILFTLEEDEIADALFDFADDEARAIVREELPHEARLSFEPA